MLLDPLFAAFLSFTLLLVVTPGGTTALVVRTTLEDGRDAGLWVAAGAAIANAGHATFAALGAGFVISRWPWALEAVRVCGGLYLGYLGVRSLWDALRLSSAPIDLTPAAGITPRHHSLHEGLGVNILNPVVLTYYVAVVPTFMRPSWPSGAYVLMAAVHVTLAFLCHCAWVLGFDRMRGLLQRPTPRRVIGLATAAAMLLLAHRVLTR